MKYLLSACCSLLFWHTAEGFPKYPSKQPEHQRGKRSILLSLILCLGCGLQSEQTTGADANPPDKPAAALATEKGNQQNGADTSNPNLGTRQKGKDWPDFLGPNRDSKSSETGILTKWPLAGPRIVWNKKLGTSYGIGTISRGRYFQFDRFGNQARLYCLNSETGKEIWRFEYPTKYRDILGYNNGPRCSPIVDGDRVYAYGAEGKLLCCRVTDGKLIWQTDTQKEYGFVQNFFGVGSTPLVYQDKLIAIVGGSPPNSPATYSGRVQGNGSGIVAWDKQTGKEKYRLTDELASYSSVVVHKIAGQAWGFAFCRGGLVGFDPDTGKKFDSFPWRASILESVNASTPVLFGNHVFITECYGPGSALLEIKKNKFEVVWTDKEKRRNKSMQAHWNTPIYHQGHLYGSSGRHSGNAELRCIDAITGEVKWSEPGLKRSSLLYVDGHFLCLSEDGMLRLIKATPEKYHRVETAVLKNENDQPLLEYPAWAAPILSHGLLYVRGVDELVCLELIPE